MGTRPLLEARRGLAAQSELRHDRENVEVEAIYRAPLRKLVFRARSVHGRHAAQTEVCATNHRRYGAQITSYFVNVGAEFPEFPQGLKPILSKLQVSEPFVPLGKLKLRPTKPIYETASRVCATNYRADRAQTEVCATGTCRLISTTAAGA